MNLAFFDIFNSKYQSVSGDQSEHRHHESAADHGDIGAKESEELRHLTHLSNCEFRQRKSPNEIARVERRNICAGAHPRSLSLLNVGNRNIIVGGKF